MTRPAGLPRWLYVPAVVGVVFVGLPLLAMAVKVDWPNFAALVSRPSSRIALLLSMRTAAASTALCLVLGVPLALVLARSDGRLARPSSWPPSTRGLPATSVAPSGRRRGGSLIETVPPAVTDSVTISER